MSKHAKSADGLIHLISAINGEYTLCGDAFEGACSEHDEDYAWYDVKPQPVTCDKCVSEIINCRGVRVKS